MDKATYRRSIALKSPFNPPDLRPRCETCHRLLSRADFVSYWDGCPDL